MELWHSLVIVILGLLSSVQDKYETSVFFACPAYMPVVRELLQTIYLS